MIPEAMLRHQDEMPYVALDDSLPFIDQGVVKLKLLHVDIEAGLWVIQNSFAPGTQVQKHKHTGQIFAFTSSGSWYYHEYPNEVNKAGSYLFEPAGSVHTLYVPKENDHDTEVIFVMNGANLNLGPDDQVESVVDAGSVSELYLSLCEMQGFERPKILGL